MRDFVELSFEMMKHCNSMVDGRCHRHGSAEWGGVSQLMRGRIARLFDVAHIW